MEAVGVIIFVVLSVSISSLQARCHRRMITKHIQSMDGEVIRIKSNLTGPFLGIRRGSSVYRVEYRTNTLVKEGWVKFGDLFGPEWRL